MPKNHYAPDTQQPPSHALAPLNKRRKQLLRVLFTVVTLSAMLFIFYNSSEIGAISGGKSAAVTAWLNAICNRLDIGFHFTEHFVRKLAHFAEYALLGFFLMLTLRVYTQRILSFISWPLFLGLLIPVCDEFYQTFVPARSGIVRDVVIDFCGVCAGLVCGLFFLLLVRMYTVLRKSKAAL